MLKMNIEGNKYLMILTYTFVADSTIYGTYKAKIHAEGISFFFRLSVRK